MNDVPGVEMPRWKCYEEVHADKIISIEEKFAPDGDDFIGARLQAREILRTVRTQLMVTNQAKRPVPTDCLQFAEK